MVRRMIIRTPKFIKYSDIDLKVVPRLISLVMYVSVRGRGLVLVILVILTKR